MEWVLKTGDILMVLDISSTFYDILNDGGYIKNHFTLGTSDYSDYVVKWPKIKRGSELKSQTVSITLANGSGDLNPLYENTYNSVIEAKLSIGINDPLFNTAGSYDTNEARSIYPTSDYIYVADGAEGIKAFTFSGSEFIPVGSYDTIRARFIYPTSDYIYVADNTEGIKAFTFSGSEFTPVGSYDTYFALSIYPTSDYIYVADNTAGIKAFTFSGSEFTPVGFYETYLALSIYPTSDYIYVADHTAGIKAFTFSGSEFTPVGSYDTNIAYAIYPTSDYIYVADGAEGIKAFTFSGSEFTPVGSYVISEALSIYPTSDYIYVADGDQGIKAFTFSGSEFIPVGSYDTIRALSIYPTSDYIYVADLTAGIKAFTFTPEQTPLYTGDLSNIKYNNLQATISLKDKLWKLSDNIIGSDESPVSFTNIIPSDIAWDIMTCYGFYDSTASTSNIDIDYDSFLLWSSVFSSDNILMSAYYNGTKTLTALSDIAESTRSTIWINESGKMQFDRFGGVTVSSETFLISEREQLDFEVDVTAKDAVNNYGVNYDYNVDSDSFASIEYSVNTDSVTTIGELQENLEIDTIWYDNETDARVIGQREVFLYGKPPRLWKTATGLNGLNRTISELSRLENDFYGVYSDSVWRITDQQIDMGSGRVDLTFDSAVSLYGFYLDIDSLDTTSRFLL